MKKTLLAFTLFAIPLIVHAQDTTVILDSGVVYREIICVGSHITATPDDGSKYAAFSPDGVPFVVAAPAWDIDKIGNHRAVVEVSAQTEAVRFFLPWRRQMCCRNRSVL